MSELYTTETLLRYLDGEMEGDELAAFENSLASNASLREELSQLKAAIGAVQLAGAESRVRQIHEEMRMKPGKAKTVPMFPRYFMRVAAAAVLLLCLAAGWFYSISSADRISADHFVPYVPDASRSAGGSAAIEDAFRKGDHATVLGVAGNGTLRSGDSLLVALAFYNTGRYPEAEHWLRALQRSPQYHWDADYYLAFTCLMEHKRSESLDIFRKIHQDAGHLYHSSVTTMMLRKLGFRSH